VLLLGWDGVEADLTELEPATHVLTNAGHMYPPGRDNLQKPPDEKAARFGRSSPRAARPATRTPRSPMPGVTGSPWPRVTACPPPNPAPSSSAGELPDGRVYGSTSVTLVALAADGRLRYDFQPDPQADGDWYPVETA